jgi:ATP-dependent RNA helicase SUPV3L1/SUV3
VPAPGEDRGGRPPRERFHGRDRDKDNRGEGDRPRGDRPNDRPGDRPKNKFEGKFGGGRDKGGRDRDKGGRDKGDRDGRSGGGPSHRQYATSASPRDRDRPIDPNSPFAKLAALKEQLAANRKDG